MSARRSPALQLPPAAASIGDALAAFRFDGKPTLVELRAGVPFYINEFWTARQRQAHALHEISYRACFKPQLPAFFIERLTAPGDCVYDPFMGRGTTPIQAALMGRRAIGNDINPLSTLLARPRLAPPTLAAIAERLARIDWRGASGGDAELLAFYHPDTLAQIQALRAYLLERQRREALDGVDDWIRMVAINRLTGHSPGFFSVYSLPPNQAVSVASQQRINQRRGQTPPRRDVADLILRKSRALLKDGAPPAGADGRFLSQPAERTPQIAAGSVDLVVTSPPFLDVVDYAGDNWLRNWFAGLDPAQAPITRAAQPPAWRAFVAAVFGELARVVRPGGHVAFEVGEVRAGQIALEDLVLQALNGLPFEPLGVVVNAQTFTKTANCWGVDNNAKGTNSNRIVLARRR